jgi:hypothetical protein
VSRRDEHDGAIDELLQRQFVAEELASTTSCLDEETLAAWFDDRLTPAERETAEIHLAGCSRCQAILAAMVRIEPPAAAAPGVLPLSRRWAGWFVPAAAAAVIAVVAVWAVVGRGPAPTQVADTMARAETAERAPSPPAVAPPRDAAGDSASSLRQEAARVPTGTPGPEPAAKTRSPSRPAASATPQGADQERRDVQESIVTQDNAATRDSAVPQDKLSAPPEAQAQAQPQLEDQQDALRKMEQAAAPPPPPRAQAFTLGSAAPLAVVASPDRASRWRLAGSTVEHSSDGINWSPAYTGSVRLNAAAAPSSSVCWVVGERGTVLRSTDGQRFAPAAAPAVVDLVSVSASDALTASVTAADGRRFSTSDGGATWAAGR